MELRFIKTGTEVRVSGDGKTLQGYAAVFNRRSTDNSLGFREVCHQGMFARAIRTQADVKCLRDHDSSMLLGRTKSGTLRLAEDTRGLHFECDLPNTSDGRDVQELCTRGDLDEMSFGFVAQKQDWEDGVDEETGQSCAIRHLRDVDLIDVSPVTYPAYPGTSAQVRSLFVGAVPERVAVECRSRGIRVPTLTEVVEVSDTREARKGLRNVVLGL
jgi:HK97 family phage prohead protease